jgi:hypothetical protein
MNQLPPIALTRVWLAIIKDDQVPQSIIQNRISLLNKHFGSVEIASMYIEQGGLK